MNEVMPVLPEKFEEFEDPAESALVARSVTYGLLRF